MLQTKYVPAYPDASYDTQGFCLKHPMIRVCQPALDDNEVTVCLLCAGGEKSSTIHTSSATCRYNDGGRQRISRVYHHKEPSQANDRAVPRVGNRTRAGRNVVDNEEWRSRHTTRNNEEEYELPMKGPTHYNSKKDNSNNDDSNSRSGERRRTSSLRRKENSTANSRRNTRTSQKEGNDDRGLARNRGSSITIRNRSNSNEAKTDGKPKNSSRSRPSERNNDRRTESGSNKAGNDRYKKNSDLDDRRRTSRLSQRNDDITNGSRSHTKESGRRSRSISIRRNSRQGVSSSEKREASSSNAVTDNSRRKIRNTTRRSSERYVSRDSTGNKTSRNRGRSQSRSTLGRGVDTNQRRSASTNRSNKPQVSRTDTAKLSKAPEGNSKYMETSFIPLMKAIEKQCKEIRPSSVRGATSLANSRESSSSRAVTDQSRGESKNSSRGSSEKYTSRKYRSTSNSSGGTRGRSRQSRSRSASRRRLDTSVTNRSRSASTHRSNKSRRSKADSAKFSKASEDNSRLMEEIERQCQDIAVNRMPEIQIVVPKGHPTNLKEQQQPSTPTNGDSIDQAKEAANQREEQQVSPLGQANRNESTPRDKGFGQENGITSSLATPPGTATYHLSHGPPPSTQSDIIQSSTRARTGDRYRRTSLGRTSSSPGQINRGTSTRLHRRRASQGSTQQQSNNDVTNGSSNSISRKKSSRDYLPDLEREDNRPISGNNGDEEDWKQKHQSLKERGENRLDRQLEMSSKRLQRIRTRSRSVESSRERRGGINGSSRAVNTSSSSRGARARDSQGPASTRKHSAFNQGRSSSRVTTPANTSNIARESGRSGNTGRSTPLNRVSRNKVSTDRGSQMEDKEDDQPMKLVIKQHYAFDQKDSAAAAAAIKSHEPRTGFRSQRSFISKDGTASSDVTPKRGLNSSRGNNSSARRQSNNIPMNQLTNTAKASTTVTSSMDSKSNLLLYGSISNLAMQQNIQQHTPALLAPANTLEDNARSLFPDGR